MNATADKTAAELEQKVSERLAALPDVDSSTIEPHAEGTKVVLEGSVDTVFSARKAVLSAETVDGVHDVESHLALTGKNGASASH
ncbi:osmotically-inducible protein OsmY [Neorhizobium sp. 2083]|uniref:BON domain-containing protein n=1 Tax=Neorhizobium sp. 2083 TaxID=2817762 RepID=UPI0028561F43|nr:BON domain-containing protein [Neorhizobium sp. 2083]MDR6818649.1 osmotically-inducible protein OsmY [Neorhizobium sp. 2083]